MTTWILLIALAFIPVQIVSRVVYNLFFSPLKNYPGPKLWAISRLPQSYHLLNGTLHTKLLEIHQQYGKVVRTAPTHLSFASEVGWKDVYGHRQGHEEFPKSYLTQPLTVNGVFGILSANRADHARFRKLFSHAFSDKGLREQEPRIVQYVDLLIKRLRESKGSQNMVQWFTFTTFDIIGDLSFGESFGCLEGVRLHPWVQAVTENLRVTVTTGFFRYYGLLTYMTRLLPKRLAKMRMDNYAYASEKIERRVAFGKDRGDFFDNVLKHEGDDGMTIEEMKSNSSNLVLAGSETTATLLSGTIYLLQKHPEVHKRVVEEIRSTFTSDDEITIQSASNLKYMLAVLQETMRVYPPVTAQGARDLPPGGDTIDGKFLPENVEVSVPQYAAYRLESNFTKPSEFIPERFLGAPEFANDNYAVLQPFSIGPRNCIGKNLAYAEMRLILAKLLYHFDISLAPAMQEQDWIAAQKSYAVWQKVPLWVDLKPVPSKA